ncbi:TolC family protein [Flavobacteriaceae bacterium XHP0103]|uniref:TolC family protein n=1 Tax=Marixanthotalea marina TaxID=2844359 RepID=UPI002989CE00|nr:TolC family protein [Marixanthotalea marina]MBU3820939.1 TolC family protein [Marixanthotalea marina]
MKQIKRAFTIGVFLVGALGFSQKKWTLQESINHALENNITIKKAENTLLINDEDITAAKGSFLPTVSGSASHSISLGQSQLFEGAFVNRTSNSTNFGVRVSENIFNGFRNTYLYEQAKLNLETSQLELSRIQDDISLNVANSYLNALFNKEQLETAITQFEFSKKQLSQVKDLVEAGTQPKVNIYDAEATLANDEQAVTVAENNYNLALLSLSQLLQVPFEGFDIEVIEIDSPSEALLYNNASPILEYALQNRSEIGIAEKNIENSELNTKISKAGFLPSVNFGYSLGANVFYTNLNDNENPFFRQLEDNLGHNFNLSVNIPIFSQFQNKTNVAKSLIQEENAKLDLEQAKLTLESNIQAAFTDAQAAFKTYEAAKKSLASQELAFENAQERYNIGAMNAFELEQSRVRYINAQSSLITAKYDFVFKTKVLDFYMGKTITID